MHEKYANVLPNEARYREETKAGIGKNQVIGQTNFRRLVFGHKLNLESTVVALTYGLIIGQRYRHIMRLLLRLLVNLWRYMRLCCSVQHHAVGIASNITVLITSHCIPDTLIAPFGAVSLL